MSAKSPHTFMGFDAAKKSATARTPTVISRKCIPEVHKHYPPSSTPPIVGEKGEISMLGFTGTALYEKASLYLSEDYTHNWITNVSPTTKDENKVIMILPSSELLSTWSNINEPASGEAWALISHSVLLLFWGMVQLSEGLVPSIPEVLQHMSDYHPLVVLHSHCFRENIFIKET